MEAVLRVDNLESLIFEEVNFFISGFYAGTSKNINLLDLKAILKLSGITPGEILIRKSLGEEHERETILINPNSTSVIPIEMPYPEVEEDEYGD